MINFVPIQAETAIEKVTKERGHYLITCTSGEVFQTPPPVAVRPVQDASGKWFWEVQSDMILYLNGGEEKCKSFE